MYKLLRKLLYLLPIPVFVACVSIAGDPARIFSSSYERKISSILLAGKNATGVSNFDERLLQKEYAKGGPGRKDILVIGSSRSMQIHSGLFPGKSLYNAGVSGANLEDYIGIYNICRNSPIKPSTVIIGLDPWVLNRNSGEFRWKSISEDVEALTGELLGEQSRVRSIALKFGRHRQYLEAFSPDYFRKSLKTVFHKRNADPVATTAQTGESDTILSDGSRSYNTKYISRSGAEVDAEAIAYTEARPVYLLGEFHELDPVNKLKLEKLIDLIQKERIVIRFFLPPYHPEAYKRLLSIGNYKMIEIAEEYFRALAKNRSIPVYGSYNPENFNLASSDFYDGMHPRTESMQYFFTPGPLFSTDR